MAPVAVLRGGGEFRESVQFLVIQLPVADFPILQEEGSGKSERVLEGNAGVRLHTPVPLLWPN